MGSSSEETYVYLEEANELTESLQFIFYSLLNKLVILIIFTGLHSSNSSGSSAKVDLVNFFFNILENIGDDYFISSNGFKIAFGLHVFIDLSKDFIELHSVSSSSFVNLRVNLLNPFIFIIPFLLFSSISDYKLDFVWSKFYIFLVMKKRVDVNLIFILNKNSKFYNQKLNLYIFNTHPSILQRIKNN